MGYMVDETHRVSVDHAIEGMNRLIKAEREHDEALYEGLREQLLKELALVIDLGSGRINALTRELLKVYGGFYGSPDSYITAPDKRDDEQT
jgi:hypothetical protein